jgi:hypothetical protein
MHEETREPSTRSAYDGLQIDEDMGFQRLDWAAERVAWSFLSLVILAALLGLFSRGPLSEAEARDADGALRVTYERFLRHGTASSLDIEAGPPATQAEQVKLRLRGSMLRGLQIQTVRPTPLESHLAEDGWIMTFPVGDKGRTSLIRMEIRPEGLATLSRGRSPSRDDLQPGSAPSFTREGMFMNSVLRAVAIYLALLVLFRVAGRAHPVGDDLL